MNEQFQQYIAALAKSDSRHERTPGTENGITIHGTNDTFFLQFEFSDVLTTAVKLLNPEAIVMKEVRSSKKTKVVNTMYTCVLPYKQTHLLNMYINLQHGEELPKNFTVNVFAVDKTNFAYDYEKSRNLFLPELAPIMDAFKETVLSLPKYRLLDATGLINKTTE